jgi:hypothetical protein
MRRSWRWGWCTAVAAVLLLTGAAVAVAAATGAYKGKTSQNQVVTFKLSSRAVSNFTVVINDRCPDGHTLQATGHYPSMPISRGKFGGRFVPVGGHRGEKATLSGTVGRSKVTGSIQDTSYSKRERRLCHGSTTFSAKHV